MSTDVWETLRLKIIELQEECAGRLFAVWTTKPAPGWWRLDYWNANDRSHFIKRFDWLARRVAAELGFTGVEFDAVSFWLDRLRHDAPESVNQPFVIRRDNGEDPVYSQELHDVCYWSAHYCHKCEADAGPARRAMERSQYWKD